MPLAAALLLAGCSSGSSMNPVNWWHNLEGGAIAEQRPPPPGANAPFPNLSTVPAQPQPPNLKDLNAITAGLVADREHAQHEAAGAPLADPSSPNASPGLFGVGTAPPPPPPSAATSAKPSAEAPAKPAASASLAAASPPPQKPAVPEAPPPPLQINRAPVGAVKSSPLPGPTAYQPSGAGQAIQTAAIPAMPASPPAPPGVGRPAAAPAASAPRPAPLPAGTVLVSFAPGSSALPADSAAMLKPLVAKRGSAAIAVTGHGDATSSDPSAQSAALTLGLARAKAVAAALAADGVPASATHVGAQATGRGATVRLLQ